MGEQWLSEWTDEELHERAWVGTTQTAASAADEVADTLRVGVAAAEWLRRQRGFLVRPGDDEYTQMTKLLLTAVLDYARESGHHPGPAPTASR